MRRLIVLLLVATAGCHRSSDQPAATPTAPHREQRLTSATISDPKTFNPLLAVDQASVMAVGDLFDGLVRLNPLTLAMEPMLAERWEYNADGTVCTFHLRHDVRWHDGQPLTAADVAFTFDALYDERVPNSVKYLLLVDGKHIQVEVVDDYTVRLTLPRPFAPLINSLSQPILPKHLLGAALKDGTFAQQWGIDTPPEKIIGTGPYRMVRYVPAQFIEYQRNPDYWMKDDAGARLPYLEAQTRLIVPTQDTMYLKFLAGQTDFHSPRPEEVAELRAKSDALKIVVSELGIDPGTTFVSFNRNPRHYVKDDTTDPRLTWFTDPIFLRAIAHAIDKQAMILNCLNGYGKPAVAEISPENKVYHNPNLTDYAYDLNEAKRLLNEGGYTDRDGDGVLEDREGNPVRVLSQHQRRQSGARKDVLDPEGRLDQARHEGELPAARLHDAGGEDRQHLRLGRDPHRLHGNNRAEQRRQSAALERQPAFLEPEPAQAGDDVGGRDRQLARPGLARDRRAEAPQLLLAHPGNLARAAADDPNGAPDPVPGLQDGAAELPPDRVGVVPSGIDPRGRELMH